MSRSASGRRALTVVLAAALALPTSVQAASQADAAALASRAAKEFQAARTTSGRDARAGARGYASAGFLYARAAAALPEVAAHRETRSDLLGQAGSAYLEAHRLAPEDPTPLRAARTLAGTHVAALTASYGAAASGLVEYERARALIAEVDALLGGPAPAPVVERPAERRADWRRVGLGTSLALAGVSLAAAMGTGFAVTRKPFTGPLYRDILAAATDNGVPHAEGDKMCELGRAMHVGAVVDACATRDRVWHASIAMMVVSGVFVVSAIVFGSALARSRRAALARLHRHQAGIAVAPGPGGVFVGAGARF